MAVFTKRQLVEYYLPMRSNPYSEKEAHRRALEEIELEAAQFNKDKYFDIFLSHDFNDFSVILGLKRLLLNKGYSVFVKNCDDPEKKINYDILRNCSSLLYLTSISSAPFKITPWQIAYMFKQKGRVSIVPILDDHLSLYEIETLWQYPYLDFTDETFYVHKNSSSWINFDNWIKGINPRKFNL